MKTNALIKIIFLFSAVVGLAACNDDDEYKWYDSMEDGGPFLTGNTLRFYYVDEEGNDLIDRNDYTTLPFSSDTLLSVPPVISTTDMRKDNYLVYNDRINSVLFLEQEGVNEFFTFAYGDSRESTYTFYVYFKGKPDKMEVTYWYLNSKVTDVLGRPAYTSSIRSWKVNGQTVYSSDTRTDGMYYRKVYLHKDADGNTISITFES